MLSKFKSLLFVSACCLTMSLSAHAEIFFYEDQDDRFTISFPDTWAVINNQKADDKLTIAGPGVNDHAICKVRVRSDRRFVIYPPKFDSDIQKIAYSHEFWKDYLGDYNEVVVDTFKDEAGLGLGFASMAEASFETAEGQIVRKRGVMFASLYHDQMYAVDCSAEASVYKKWRPAFLNVVKSIDFKNVRHVSPSGHYRAFLNDKPVEVLGPEELDSYKF